MDKETFEIQSLEYLSGTLSAEERNAFEKNLENNPGHQQDFNQIKEAWNQVQHLTTPEPSEEMDNRFHDMLYNEKQKSRKTNEHGKGSGWLATILQGMMRPQLAYGIVLLCLGLGIGYFMSPGQGTGTTTTIVNTETEEVRGDLVLTLLEQPSANKRLQGVSEANKFEKANDRIIMALLQTLNNDPNVNVRLAAIESLTNYVDNPLVREGLVKAIVKQESPIVQVTLADLMVALQEKKSVEPFKELIRTKELDESVKQKLETSIHSII